jgi:hypothetical protein
LLSPAAIALLEKELSLCTPSDQPMNRMVGNVGRIAAVAAGRGENRPVAAAASAPARAAPSPFSAPRLTANSLENQLFEGNSGGRDEPVFLASGGIIHYPEQSATGGIRSI